MKQVYHLLMFVLITFTSFSQAKQTSSLKPGQTFHDCKDCPEMVVIPAGSFTMGSTVSELGNNFYTKYELSLEGVLRVVNIHEFAAGKFDITRGEWAAFVKATNRATRGGCSWSGIPQDSTKNIW